MQHILSASQFSKSDVERILSIAAEMEEQCKNNKVEKILQDKIVACMFFEPSTRTRLSFETAALKLGAGVISTENAAENSSAHKGETIEDTTRMLNCYADAIVIRHFKAGEPEAAAKVSSVPVINAGDGPNQHPSQALLDLYTIKKELGSLENLNIAFVGDLIYGRTLHSLVPLLTFFPNNKFYFVSPKELAVPDGVKKMLAEKNIAFEESQDFNKVLGLADVLYMTRVQKERFKNLADYEKVKDAFLLKAEHLEKMKAKSMIMHPLPRVNEIDPKIDADHRAAYFRQAQNALYVRMAIFKFLLF